MNADFTSVLDTYIFDEGNARFQLSRFRVERGDIHCEVEVHWTGDSPGLLHHGKLNLVSDLAVTKLRNILEGRINNAEVDWFAMLTGITYAAKERYRNGEPPIKLSDVDDATSLKWLLRPLIETGGPTVLAAPGGSAKSMLALAIGATVATGRGSFLNINAREKGAVLYLDWEADKYAHKNRLEAMCRAADVEFPTNIYYRREYAPLHESVDELSRQVHDLGIKLVIVDSKGASLSGAPEEADGTLRFFRGLRGLGSPALVVDHVTNQAASGKGPQRPFGSVYTQNMARNVWMAQKTTQEEGSTSVLWKHTKSNNGPTGRKLAFRMDFDLKDADTDNERYDRIRIKQVSPLEVAETGQGSLKEQLVSVLRRDHEPKTVFELESLTGHASQVIRARLSEGAKENVFVNLSSGKTGLWMLAEDYKQQEGIPK